MSPVPRQSAHQRVARQQSDHRQPDHQQSARQQFAQQQARRQQTLERLAQVLLGVSLVVSELSRFTPARYLSLLLPLLFVGLLMTAGASRLSAARVPVPVLLFLAWIAASYVWSADPAHTVRSLLDVAWWASTALVAGLLLSLEQVRATVTRVVQGVLVLTVLVLVVAPGSSTTPPEGDPAPGWHSIFDHKNGLGGFLILAFVTLALHRTRWRPVWLLVVLVLLVGSQSSTALGAVLFAGSLLLWRAGQQRIAVSGVRASVRVLSGMALGLLVVVATVVPTLLPSLLGRSGTLTGRTEIWAAVERQIGLHPLLGLGWGGAWTPASVPTLAMWREARFQAFYAHNGYLELLLQLGSVGALLFLALVGTACVRLVRHPDRRSALWAGVVVLSLAVSAFSESSPFLGGGGGGLLLIVMFAVVAGQRSADPSGAPRTGTGGLGRPAPVRTLRPSTRGGPALVPAGPPPAPATSGWS